MATYVDRERIVQELTERIRCRMCAGSKSPKPAQTSRLSPDRAGKVQFQYTKSLKYGAAGGNRTPDIQLGKLTFYL